MPFHRGAAEAPDAEALMRSRYSAFALKEVEYLWRTLHETNEERQHGREEVIRAIKGSALRFMGLTILDRNLVEPPGPSQVLFLAKVFDKGRDVSFIELSDFLHDGAGWRYASGVHVPMGEGKAKPTRLTIEEFLRSVR